MEGWHLWSPILKCYMHKVVLIFMSLNCFEPLKNKSQTTTNNSYVFAIFLDHSIYGKTTQSPLHISGCVKFLNCFCAFLPEGNRCSNTFKSPEIRFERHSLQTLGGAECTERRENPTPPPCRGDTSGQGTQDAPGANHPLSRHLSTFPLLPLSRSLRSLRPGLSSGIAL